MNNTAKKHKTIDLFCGIFGIRKGFKLTNSFQNILSAKIDKYTWKKINYWLVRANLKVKNKTSQLIQNLPWSVTIATP